MICTNTDSYVNVFLTIKKENRERNHGHESMKIVRGLYKLFFLTNKMAKGAKQNVHWWKETAFYFVWLVLSEGNQARFELFIAIL